MKNYYEEIKELEEKNEALSGKLDYKALIKAKKSGDMNKYRMLELQQDDIIRQVDKNRKRIEVLEVCNSIEKNNYRYNFLTENIEKIKANRDKFVIFAVNKVLRTLEANGITPDFAVCLDASAISATYTGLEDYCAKITT